MGVWIRRFGADERGATSIEYAMIASIMVAAIVGGATVFSDHVLVIYDIVTTSVEAVSPS